MVPFRDFGPLWENDIKHTPQHFRNLIFLLWHYKVVIMIIVAFPIISFDFGCGKKNNKNNEFYI